MAVVVERPAVAQMAAADGADWCAIFAGTAVAAAISTTLLAFGTAIGLSFTGNWPGPSAMGAAVAVGLWLCFIQISGFLGGGYIAGRLRRRSVETTAHEAEIRDGAYGLIVWAVSTIIVVAGTALVAAHGAATGTAAVSAAAETPVAYYADLLFRPADSAPAAAAGSGQGNRAAVPGAAQIAADSRAEAGRILTRSLTGTVDESDRTYLAQAIASSAGMSEDQAMARVDDTLAKARAAAEKARQTAVLYGFLTAASLLVGALAAWWAAMRGGAHRDQGTDFSRLTAWR